MNIKNIKSEGRDVMKELTQLVSSCIKNNKQVLTALDQAIGDGDHGVNMCRGFDAVDKVAIDFSTMPFGDACTVMGKTLVMNVGGASGPLFGSCLMAFGKVSVSCPESREELVVMLSAGIDAVKSRGKSDVGAKTMLDVLVPLRNALQSGSITSFAEARDFINKSVEDTKPILATKGRAAFLGERSIGHIDPGAKTTALIADAVCSYMEKSE